MSIKKGTTYEQLYGDRAEEEKAKHSKGLVKSAKSGKRRTSKGRKQSIEARKKMSNAKKALIASGEWHPPNNKKGKSFEEQYGAERALEIKAQGSKSLKETIAARPGRVMHQWTKESRKKLRDSCIENILLGKTAPHTHRYKAITTIVQSIKGGTVRCQGSWENAFVSTLDVDKSVVSFTKDKIRIPYLLNNEQYIYIVDFLVTYSCGKKELIEIKPAKLTETDENIAKFAAARTWCAENNATFVVLTENELFL